MIGSSGSERAFQASQSPFTPPHAAHRIFADRAPKDGRECPPHPTRIGPGKIGARGLVWGFLRQAVVLGLLSVFCSERERPFFVPSPAIRFPERAEGVKGPKR
jgi:hypothetical protein